MGRPGPGKPFKKGDDARRSLVGPPQMRTKMQGRPPLPAKSLKRQIVEFATEGDVPRALQAFKRIFDLTQSDNEKVALDASVRFIEIVCGRNIVVSGAGGPNVIFQLIAGLQADAARKQQRPERDIVAEINSKPVPTAPAQEAAPE